MSVAAPRPATLGSLDRYLTLWIFLATTVGVGASQALAAVVGPLVIA